MKPKLTKKQSLAGNLGSMVAGATTTVAARPAVGSSNKIYVYQWVMGGNDFGYSALF
jgi:hypothetical protein